MADVVVIQSLEKRYGRAHALRGLDLTVRGGEIFGLLGPNGAGKSTLIKTLIGSARPTSGTVRVLGLDPHRDARALRPQLGYMPQAPALYDDLSARDNVRFFARAHGVDGLDQRVDGVLSLIGLADRAHDAVYTFSGGMKQRVSLACALVHEPAILLLDEPTAGVDFKLRVAFWDYFRDLARRGSTIFVSTHQMDEALHCDRLAIIREGTLLACEPPTDLLRRGQPGDSLETIVLSLIEQQEAHAAA